MMCKNNTDSYDEIISRLEHQVWSMPVRNIADTELKEVFAMAKHARLNPDPNAKRGVIALAEED